MRLLHIIGIYIQVKKYDICRLYKVIISSLEAIVPWLRLGFNLHIASDSLNSNKDQWSALSIILQLLKRKSGSIHVMLVSWCGVSSNIVLMSIYWN